MRPETVVNLQLLNHSLFPGTTLVLIATDAFRRYETATGGRPDSATGLLKITASQYNALQPLNFQINGVRHRVHPSLARYIADRHIANVQSLTQCADMASFFELCYRRYRWFHLFDRRGPRFAQWPRT